MTGFISWENFVEAKSNKPPQGKGANPYMNATSDGKLRVAKDNEKKEPLGSLGGSNITPSDSSLGVPGGQGGVGITEGKKGPKSAYPKEVDGRIRVTKDKDGGKEWGDLKSPGIEPSTSSLGRSPEKGVGTTTEEFIDKTKDLSTAEFVEFVLKKK